jgi:hypothetical protein
MTACNCESATWRSQAALGCIHLPSRSRVEVLVHWCCPWKESRFARWREHWNVIVFLHLTSNIILWDPTVRMTTPMKTVHLSWRIPIMDWQKYPKSRTSIRIWQPETLDSIKCHTFPGMGGRTLEDILLHDSTLQLFFCAKGFNWIGPTK